jgi:hypothetical protein
VCRAPWLAFDPPIPCYTLSELGSDNPDNLYQSATIDSRLKYVVRGERGTVRYLGFGTQSGQYGAAGGLQTVDYVQAEALAYDDGTSDRFSITLSAERGDTVGNWLRLAPDVSPAAMFIVRQVLPLLPLLPLRRRCS